MLFILTGEIQTGKTRWLEALLDTLRQRGVVTDGVIAPGVWRKRTPEELDALNKSLQENAANASTGSSLESTDTPVDTPTGEPAVKNKLAGTGLYEKLGIDNRLLPENTIIHFAKRYDLAQIEGTFDPTSQSAKAQLGWTIDDNALAQVNKHFEQLNQPDAAQDNNPHFLVVDEFGRLELMRNAGLTNARALIEKGPTQRYPHALIVVRSQLLDRAKECFASAWDEIYAITPCEKDREKILSLVD